MLLMGFAQKSTLPPIPLRGGARNLLELCDFPGAVFLKKALKNTLQSAL